MIVRLFFVLTEQRPPLFYYTINWIYAASGVEFSSFIQKLGLSVFLAAQCNPTATPSESVQVLERSMGFSLPCSASDQLNRTCSTPAVLLWYSIF